MYRTWSKAEPVLAGALELRPNPIELRKSGKLPSDESGAGQRRFEWVTAASCASFALKYKWLTLYKAIFQTFRSSK